MEERLIQSIKLHQELIEQSQRLNTTIDHSGIILEKQINELYKGKVVKIEVFQAESPFCKVFLQWRDFLQRKSIVDRIENVIFRGLYKNFIVIEFSEGPNTILRNIIETTLSNIKSIKIVE